jgi:hypothetical protein
MKMYYKVKAYNRFFDEETKEYAADFEVTPCRKSKNAKEWIQAAALVMNYTCGIGRSSIIVYVDYNKVTHSLYKGSELYPIFTCGGNWEELKEMGSNFLAISLKALVADLINQLTETSQQLLQCSSDESTPSQLQ